MTTRIRSVPGAGLLALSLWAASSTAAVQEIDVNALQAQLLEAKQVLSLQPQAKAPKAP